MKSALSYALLLFSLRALAQTPDEDSKRFSAAIALEAGGHYAEAVTALETFAHERSTSSLAPDALAEAADLSEARLFDPARALVNFSTLVAQYPQSRLFRRAAARKADLEGTLADPHADASALGMFARLLSEAGERPNEAARARVAQFLVEHPGFPRADEGADWLGHAAERAGDHEEALRRYDEASRGTATWSARATTSKAALLLRRGRMDEAQATYESLVRYPDPTTRSARLVGLADVHSARIRRALSIASYVVLALFLVLHARRFRFRPIPVEARFFTPIAAVFVVITWFQHRASVGAIALIAAGGLAITWLSARRAPVSTSERILRALAALIAASALIYLAITTSDMTDAFLQTLSTGPEN